MYFLGIDISTTATKALLINNNGKVIGINSSSYSFKTPHPLWSEQHPSLWWDGTVNSVRGLLKNSGIEPSQIAGVGLTGQMHGLVLLGRNCEVLRPAILWNDQRTQDQCNEIHTRIGKSHFISITGNVSLTGFTAPKILWVQKNEPQIYQHISHVLLPKDYVRYKLTGLFATDMADGSGTLLLDLRNRNWSQEVLEKLQIPTEWMPALFEGPDITGVITEEASLATGLSKGTPVMAGGGDQAAQAVGVGAISEGVVALTLGTSGVVFASTNEPYYHPEGILHAFCHSVPGKWHFMGVMLSAAGSLRWLHDTFSPNLEYDQLLKPAESVPPGANGLIFLPYLSGERTPYPDPFARGAFVGLTLRHGFSEITRAVLEGVAFGIKDIFELIKKSGTTSINQVRISGGGAKSQLWRQILSDVLDCELVTVNSMEGAAYGAALLAGVGSGCWADVDRACESVIELVGSVQPNPKNQDSYAKSYSIYQSLYPNLKPTFNKLLDV